MLWIGICFRAIIGFINIVAMRVYGACVFLRGGESMGKTVLHLVLALALILGAGSATAAPVQTSVPQTQQMAAKTLTGVRFGVSDEYERVVFDLTTLPAYEIYTENDGQTIVMFLSGAHSRAVQPKISGSMVENVHVSTVPQGIKVVLNLAAPAAYEVKTLANPTRLFIDVQKEYERITEEEPAPGLKLSTLRRLDERGRLTGWVLEADPARYRAVPVLAKGVVAGRATVSAMSDMARAVAAVNASYFAPSGDILGLLKMDGTVVGTTYFRRSAVGFDDAGKTFFGPVDYSGTVTLGRVRFPVGGVDAERGADSLVIYNHYYSATTHTNEYGQEYIIKGGRVASVSASNTAIPRDGLVISVHGKARDAFAQVKVGDSARVDEQMGALWETLPTVIGAGPMLVKDGRVHVTAAEEEFPSDITVGRAPRTAFGVTADGRYLLAVVDGRQSHSIGCTLQEMAEFMLQFGAVDAINFDGGGSSALVVGGKLENSPSDGAERAVGSALALLPR